MRRDERHALTQSGVHTVQVSGGVPREAYCDMSSDFGGWIVFQRREDGSVDFFRDWQDYKTGFGYPDGEFWLGLDALHNLTSEADYDLRIDFTTVKGLRYHVVYKNFSVDSESQLYRLHVGAILRMTGDSHLLLGHNNQPFSTKARDNDRSPRLNCAAHHNGGWWYNNCYRSNLNGVYVSTLNINRFEQNVEFTGLKVVEMKMRRR